MLSSLTIPQSRFIYKTTTESYADLCKEIHQEPKTLRLKENDSIAHWIGREDAEVVIFYLHGVFLPIAAPGLQLTLAGGGYTQPCTLQHMQYLYRLTTDLNQLPNGMPSFSVLLLAYNLAPEKCFPTQLKQACTMLSYLLIDGGKSPSDIMIAGDSAGGNLAISLLSHLLHPHFDIPRLQLQTPLRACVLYSPWVSFDTSHPSFERNAQKDSLVPNMLRRFAGMYLGEIDGETDPGIVSGGNNYSEPLLSNASWWRGLHGIVSNIWIYAGEDEIFVDSLRDFGAKLCEGWRDGGGVEGHVILNIVRQDAHIGPIMDVMLQYKEKSQTQICLEKWLKDLLN